MIQERMGRIEKELKRVDELYPNTVYNEDMKWMFETLKKTQENAADLRKALGQRQEQVKMYERAIKGIRKMLEGRTDYILIDQIDQIIETIGGDKSTTH